MSTNNSLICFGELMIRLGTEGYEKFVQANKFEIKFTGAEANVGISCASFGMPSYAVSMVPSHDIGQACINYLRRFGINTDYIQRGGERLGILYTETGCSQRPSKVIYDRANSSFTQLKIDEEQWEDILRGHSWFHFCGTAPAQGETAFNTLIIGLKVAKKLGLTISCDYNYRKKLWSQKEAQSKMEKLMEYVDIGIGNEEDCEAVFGVKAEGSDFQSGSIDSDSYSIVAKKMVHKYGLKAQAITLRESISASTNGWSAIISDGQNCWKSKHYTVKLVDRIGGGDSFTGGLIYCLATGTDYQEAIEFASAASCLKQTIPGDFNLSTREEVEELVKGNSSGRVQR